VVARARLKEKREGQAQSSDPTSTVSCTSSVVGAHEGERAQEFDHSYDPGDQSSMRGVVVGAAAASGVAEGSHTNSTVRVARNPAQDLALGEEAGSDT
jgi:DNA replication initiation complex subunit (GINS family)